MIEEATASAGHFTVDFSAFRCTEHDLLQEDYFFPNGHEYPIRIKFIDHAEDDRDLDGQTDQELALLAFDRLAPLYFATLDFFLFDFAVNGDLSLAGIVGLAGVILAGNLHILKNPFNPMLLKAEVKDLLGIDTDDLVVPMIG